MGSMVISISEKTNNKKLFVENLAALKVRGIQSTQEHEAGKYKSNQKVKFPADQSEHSIVQCQMMSITIKKKGQKIWQKLHYFEPPLTDEIRHWGFPMLPSTQEFWNRHRPKQNYSSSVVTRGENWSMACHAGRYLDVRCTLWDTLLVESLHNSDVRLRNNFAL